jgi:hypothetical protein
MRLYMSFLFYKFMSLEWALLASYAGPLKNYWLCSTYDLNPYI